MKCHELLETNNRDYHHFFGSPQWRAVSPGWYRRASRIIRNSIRNWSPDGLFFVVMDVMDGNKRGRYPRAALAGAPIYHYGHVRRVALMHEKLQRVGKYWGENHSAFDAYRIDPQELAPFTGSHPEIVQSWLKNEAEVSFSPDLMYQPTRRERRHRWMSKLERLTSLELSKKHYSLVVP